MAIVTEISWNDMFAGKALPDSPARTAFREAVAEIAEKAKITLPDCNGRVDAAVKIVLAGDVALLACALHGIPAQYLGCSLLGSEQICHLRLSLDVSPLLKRSEGVVDQPVQGHGPGLGHNHFDRGLARTGALGEHIDH